jgi:hypothetical protein
MNSAGFSSAEYTYVTDNDQELKTFDLARMGDVGFRLLGP